jgi:peptidyl-tRNA hydrolase
VLSRFEPAERGDIEAAIERAADAVIMFTAEGIEPVMNTFNRKDSPADEGDDQGSEKM